MIRKSAVVLAATSIAIVLTLHDVLLAQQQGYRFDAWRLAAFSMTPYLVLLIAQRYSSERALAVSVSAAAAAHLLLKCMTGDARAEAFDRLVFGPLWLAAIVIPLAHLLWRERRLPLNFLPAGRRSRRLRHWSLYLLIAPIVIGMTPIANGPWHGEISLMATAAGLLGALVCAVASFGGVAQRLALRYGTVLWYVGLALAGLAATGLWTDAASHRRSVEWHIGLNESTRVEMQKILLRYHNNREAAESVARRERESLAEDRVYRAELAAAIEAEHAALLLSSPIVVLLLLSMFRLRNGPATQDFADAVAPLPDALPVSTRLLVTVAASIVVASTLVVARGMLFYSSRSHGIMVSGILALTTSLVALALLVTFAKRSDAMKTLVVAGALAVVVLSTVWRGVENVWAANTTHEMARLATEFGVRKRVAARAYSFAQYGSYAPVLRFLHDFYGGTTELLHDVDRRMGAISVAPHGFSSVDDLVNARAAFRRYRTEAASVQNDISATIDRFAARAHLYGMSAASEASVVNGMRSVMRTDGGNLVRDIAPICDAGDRLFDFLLAHRDEVVFDREGHFLLLDEKEAEELDTLTGELQSASEQVTRTLRAREHNMKVVSASVAPSLEGYRDW